MATRQKVVTWQTPSGDLLNLCPACERRYHRGRVVPRNRRGEEYCRVFYGAHDGECDYCDAMILARVRRVHEFYNDGAGTLTGDACILAATDLESHDVPIMRHIGGRLLTTARHMDRPVSVDDVLLTVKGWLASIVEREREEGKP